MNFLKTLFWVLLAVVLALFAKANWTDVTLDLWGDIQLDIKIPVLVALAALIGFLPTFLVQELQPVMLDTFRPLQVLADAVSVEDDRYWSSWGAG